MRTLTRVVVESLASAALAACHIKSEVVMGIVVSVRGGQLFQQKTSARQ